MGRAERRRAERQERISAHKEGKLVMSRQELADIQQETRHENAKYTVESLMTCFALAEHRLYGFGVKRIVRTMGCVSELMDDIISGKATIQDYVKELEDETGCTIKCKDL